MTVALIVAVIVLFVLFCPTHIVLQYDDHRFRMYIRLWYVWKIRLFRDDDGKKAKKNTLQKEQEAKIHPKKKMTVRLEQISILLKLAVEVLRQFFKQFVMYRCRFEILVTGEDPADVATEFGTVNAAVYGIITFLNDKIKIKKKEIMIGYEYECDRPVFQVDLRFRVILLKFVLVLICTNIRDIISLIQSFSDSESVQQEVK